MCGPVVFAGCGLSAWPPSLMLFVGYLIARVIVYVIVVGRDCYEGVLDVLTAAHHGHRHVGAGEALGRGDISIVYAMHV